MTQNKYKYVATRPLPTSPRQKMGPRRWAYHQPVRSRSTTAKVIRRLLIVVIVLLLLVVLAFILISYRPPEVLFGVFVLYALSGYALWLSGFVKRRKSPPDSGR